MWGCWRRQISTSGPGFITSPLWPMRALRAWPRHDLAGLLELYRRARRAIRLLIVSRLGCEKPRRCSPGPSRPGDVQCSDSVSLSQLLSLHRYALRPSPSVSSCGRSSASPRSSGAQAPAGLRQRLSSRLRLQADNDEASSPDEIVFDGDGPEIVLDD